MDSQNRGADFQSPYPDAQHGAYSAASNPGEFAAQQSFLGYAHQHIPGKHAIPPSNYPASISPQSANMSLPNQLIVNNSVPRIQYAIPHPSPTSSTNVAHTTSYTQLPTQTATQVNHTFGSSASSFGHTRESSSSSSNRADSGFTGYNHPNMCVSTDGSTHGLMTSSQFSQSPAQHMRYLNNPCATADTTANVFPPAPHVQGYVHPTSYSGSQLSADHHWSTAAAVPNTSPPVPPMPPSFHTAPPMYNGTYPSTVNLPPHMSSPAEINSSPTHLPHATYTSHSQPPPRTQLPTPPTSRPLSQASNTTLPPPQTTHPVPTAYDSPGSTTHAQSTVCNHQRVTSQYPVYPHLPRSTASVFRTPGRPATLAEWDQSKSPIGLLQDYHLLPTDAADVPPIPAIASSVNCDPDILRCTLTNIPATAKLLAQCRLPLGLVMHPFKDLFSLPTIHSDVIVRCRSCRAYINPFVQFVESGRRWRCPVCFSTNSVPTEFFYDPVTRSYGDPSRRPEIRSATVEFIAPSEYMVRPPQPAMYLFCFDVSHNAIATGYFRCVCDLLADSLHRMPGDSRRHIGFITFDSAIHFYKLSGDTMKMIICPDLDEPFVPDCDGLINNIEECSEILVDFLRHLPDAFVTNDETNNCLGSTLQVALKLLGNTGGRITVFNTCLPNVGVGCLHSREEPSDRTTMDVKNLGPSIDYYKTFALECAPQQVAVDFFIMNSRYCDIATLSGAARFSSGSVYHYPNFYCSSQATSQASQSVADVAGESIADRLHPTSCVPHPQDQGSPVELERFRHDFQRYLTRKIGFEAVMRIRCTHGLSIQTFHGSFFVRSMDLMSLPNVNPDAGCAVQLAITESVEKYSSVCCQVSLLYTSAKGGRRIRVHTLCLPVVHSPAEVFRGADQGAIVCLIGKMAVDRVLTSGLSCAREAVVNAVADALSAYATSIGITPTSSINSFSMACPPNLRLLALYLCGMLRYTAFRVGNVVPLDNRSAALERLKSAPPNDMITLFYPALYAIHQFISKPFTSDAATLVQKAAVLRLSDYGDARVETDAHSADGSDSSSSSPEDTDVPHEVDELPGQLHLSARSISRNGVYLLDTGEMMFLLVGSGDDSETTGGQSQMLRQLLGISSTNELPIQGGPFALPPPTTACPVDAVHDTPSGVPIGRRRLMALINLLRLRRPIGSTLMCMRHDAPTPIRTRFITALVEDHTEFSPSYQEFLQMIQNLMRG